MLKVTYVLDSIIFHLSCRPSLCSAIVSVEKCPAVCEEKGRFDDVPHSEEGTHRGFLTLSLWLTRTRLAQTTMDSNQSRLLALLVFVFVRVRVRVRLGFRFLVIVGVRVRAGVGVRARFVGGVGVM
jgi:hypothetical protein